MPSKAISIYIMALACCPSVKLNTVLAIAAPCTLEGLVRVEYCLRGVISDGMAERTLKPSPLP